MLHDIVLKGSTDRSVHVKIIDSADGTPETGVVFNTSGIDLWYRREGAVRTAITEATLAALTTAHADGGFLHVSDGVYRLDLPDAAFATGANYVDFGGTVTGMIVIGGRVRLVDINHEDSVRAGLTALPNAAAEAAGGLYTRGSGAGQINQANNGQIDANAARTGGTTNTGRDIGASVLLSPGTGTGQVTLNSGRTNADMVAISGDTAAADALENAFDGTAGPVPEMGIIDQGTAQSASSTGLVLRSAAAFADDTLIGALLLVFGSDQAYWQSRYITDNALSGDSVSVDAWTVTPSGTITYKILANGPVTIPTAAQIADAVWDEATAGHTTSGTFGEQVKTDIDDILTDTGTTLQAEIDGVQADTEDIQSRLPAALVSGRIDASVGAMAANVMTAAAAASDLTTELQNGLATASALSGVETKIDTIDNFLDTEIAAILSDTNAIKAVTDLLTAAQSEPTGVPAANATPLVKVAWVFMALRNRIDITSSKKTFYDDGGAAEWEKDLSDDGTTYSESEGNAI